MECPECGLFNADTAKRCDCGCDLERVDLDAARELKARSKQQARALIAFVLLVGACWVGYDQWQDWTFREAAASLGLGSNSSFPLTLLVCFVVAVVAARMAWLALRGPPTRPERSARKRESASQASKLN